MKLSSTVISLVTSFSVVGLAIDVRYDTVYDNSKGSLSTVTCSDGANGLLTKGFTTFGSLPSFPNIGAAQVVEGWNSSACGTCWQITYVGKSINVTAIDTGNNGFILSLGAMNTLTGGHAKDLGVISAQATQISKSYCGL
ncbi:Cerato-platanin [Lactarius vividus]|nr:Cerato-platanin [Lactarius vividus]